MLGAPWCGMRIDYRRGLGLTSLKDKERVESGELLVVAQKGGSGALQMVLDEAVSPSSPLASR